MSLSKAIGFGVVGLVALAGLTYLGVTIHYKDRATNFEMGISREYRSAQLYLSSFTLKVQDAIGLKKLDVGQLKDTLVSLMQAKMGQDGSKALVQFFQDQGIPYNNQTTNTIMNMVNAGRDEYRLQQEKLNGFCTLYKTELAMTVDGAIYAHVGKPADTKDFQLDMCDLVLDDDTVEAYRTKRAKPISFQ